ncbi:MAG: hypothetical protein CVV42_17420 [Candidatus Riflebacteria bacterium HGW-Riflebacteria-2]|jgi:hypothetical protein|nr:MAG: hypothetical protein CVV42_17420 [Candidatus Riflebacteria bacterium HGW-Riflebacteria-2]
MYLIIGAGFLFIVWIFYADIRKGIRRRKILKEPFPDHYVEILARQLPFYSRLSEDMKIILHGKILVFLDEVRFEGCGGQEITDDIKLTISGQASLLLINDEGSFFNLLQVVLVYPSTYVAKKNHPDGTIEESVRLGESWMTGEVILAWDDVLHGIKNTNDGQDVVIHEFAHQLDQQSGAGNGAPVLNGPTAYASWARVLGHEYKELKKRKQKFKKTLMDKYGATNPAEFFAVATETFFEKPEQMQEKHPELFEELKKYYRIDPLILA